MTRYEYAPLEAIIPGSAVNAAAVLGVDRKQIRRWQADGMSARHADRCAVLLGHHPVEVWPSWFDYEPPTCGWRDCDALVDEYSSYCSSSHRGKARHERLKSALRTGVRDYTEGQKEVVPASRKRPGTVADPSLTGARNG